MRRLNSMPPWTGLLCREVGYPCPPCIVEAQAKGERQEKQGNEGEEKLTFTGPTVFHSH